MLYIALECLNRHNSLLRIGEIIFAGPRVPLKLFSSRVANSANFNHSGSEKLYDFLKVKLICVVVELK